MVYRRCLVLFVCFCPSYTVHNMKTSESCTVAIATPQFTPWQSSHREPLQHIIQNNSRKNIYTLKFAQQHSAGSLWATVGCLNPDVCELVTAQELLRLPAHLSNASDRGDAVQLFIVFCSGKRHSYSPWVSPFRTNEEKRKKIMNESTVNKAHTQTHTGDDTPSKVMKRLNSYPQLYN